MKDAYSIITEGLERYAGPRKVQGDTLMVQCPFHDDRSPSLGIYMVSGMEIPLGFFHCLSKETLVVTDKGTRKIHKLVGKKTQVIDGNGEWVEVEFQNLGAQKLYEINLVRNQKTKKVYATDGHRWFLKRRKSTVTTLELKKGDYLESGKLNVDNGGIELDGTGIQHGFIFGDGNKEYQYFKTRKDGTRRKRKLYSTRANFCSEAKDEMIQYFENDAKILTYEDRRVANGFNKHWKELPSSKAPKEYIMGFLSGYFAADGCVGDGDRGTVSIACKDRKTLVRLRSLFLKVGISTFPIGKQMRKGYGEKETAIYSMNLLKTGIPAHFFLLKHHRERFEAKQQKFEYLRWKVVDVKETNRVEDVYCCEVPTTQSFVLADNLLTSNCFGCGAKGHWNSFAEKVGLPTFKEFQIVEGGMHEFLGQVNKIENKVLADHKSSLAALMSSMGKPAYFPWDDYMEWRDFDGRIVNRFGGHYVVDRWKGNGDLMLFFPVKIGDRYYGGVRAQIEKKKGRTSYVNTAGDWANDYGLFPYEFVKKRLKKYKLKFVVLVEGPRDAMRLNANGIPALSVLGANNFSKIKMRLVERLGVEAVYIMPDNDDGGKKMKNAIKKCFEEHSAGIVPKVIGLPREFDENGELIKLDPMDMDMELVNDVRRLLKKNHKVKRLPRMKGYI